MEFRAFTTAQNVLHVSGHNKHVLLNIITALESFHKFQIHSYCNDV